MSSLYPSLLGPSWASVAPLVQRIHAGSVVARGVFAVRRGTSMAARLVGALLGMPPAAEATPITLAVQQDAAGERWVRTFGDRPLVTVQWESGGLLVEGLGLVQCWFRLRADGGSLIFDQVRATFGARRFSLPLPRFLSPRIEGRAEPAGDRVRVDVRIHAPMVGLLVAYEGAVTPEEGS
ncbi:Hypothetical protein A7982_04710 [Minicystis rosea]|nr:Hypothetical protein A7982_04710 [Minicystis rosea]